MKTLITGLLIITMLSGCTTMTKVWDAYNMRPFDNNEYAQINGIRTIANLSAAKCGTKEVYSDINTLWYMSAILKNYSSGIPGNKQVTIMTAELSEMIKGLKNSYDSLKEPAVSVAYCTLKFGLIEQNAVIIQNAIGAKPR